MKLLAFFLTLVFVGFMGLLLGFLLKAFFSTREQKSIDLKTKKIKAEAEANARKILADAQRNAGALLEKANYNIQKMRDEVRENQKRINQKESSIDNRQEKLEKDKELVEREKDTLVQKNIALDIELQKQIAELAKISDYSAKDAKRELEILVEKQSRSDLFKRGQKLERDGVRELEQKAQNILVSAVHRLGNSVENDIMSTSVTLPSDDIKGKIIGKEGRNIKVFEKESGVQLVIDETPGVITISCFDPIRRAVAKIALDHLIKSGRIQPAKIEEVMKESEAKVNELILEKGKEAALEAKVSDLHPELLELLGRLYFRYSYGQNVLQHSVEMSHIAAVIAGEVGADVYASRAGSLLHDIGKAVDHEIEGTHVEIGIRILRKYNVPEIVIDAMKSHHEEYPYETLESMIVQVADSISGGRPGARSDTAGMYIKKLEGLERIAEAMPGVTSAYAISAGREIRIFVDPESVDDISAKEMARKIADQVESELKYPGEIKINVIRESRVIEYAR